MIRAFMEDLTGSDERRRRLAIAAIFVALPDEAPRLVTAIEGTAVPSGEASRSRDAAAVSDALASTRARLVQAMFSEAKSVRIDALRTLRRGWTDGEEVARPLIAQAMQDVRAREAASWAAPSSAQEQQRLSSIDHVTLFLMDVRQPWSGQFRSAASGFFKAAAPNSNDARALLKSYSEGCEAARSSSP